jgi:hypothetical protein
MMEFILQKISPSTIQQMMKMKNRQRQLPIDLVTVWAPSIHSLFPLKFRQVVKAVLMLGAKRQDGTPYHPQTHFYKLPQDVLFHILQYATPYHIYIFIEISTTHTSKKEITVETSLFRKGGELMSDDFCFIDY